MAYLRFDAGTTTYLCRARALRTRVKKSPIVSILLFYILYSDARTECGAIKRLLFERTNVTSLTCGVQDLPPSASSQAHTADPNLR
jgi:hypothetical protein